MARDRTAGDRDGRSLMDRRSYLKLAGAAVASVVAAGAAGTASAEKRHDTVVDMVEAGADPTGTTFIDPVLERVAGDDTRLVFPDGDYLLASFRRDDLSNFGVTADAASLVAPAGARGDWIRLRGGRDHAFSGLTFDLSRSDDARVELRPDDGLSLRRTAVTGWHAPTPHAGSLVVGLRNDDARGTVRDLRFGGSTVRGSPSTELVATPANAGGHRLAVDGTLDGGADERHRTFSGDVDRLDLAGRTSVRCRPTR